MRSRYAIPHDQIPSYPDQRKNAGYYIANGGKTDYNIGSRDNKEVWGGSETGDWSQGKEGQLFFTVVNSGGSQEIRHLSRHRFSWRWYRTRTEEQPVVPRMQCLRRTTLTAEWPTTVTFAAKVDDHHATIHHGNSQPVEGHNCEPPGRKAAGT